MVKRDIITMAAKNLMRRKGRTFLTMLGVLIGTTSIVVMVSLGIGLQQSQQKMYEQWGSLNEIEVNQSYSHGDDEENIVALDDDALEYFQSLEGVTAVIPMASISADTATCGKLQGWLDVYGIKPEDMATKNMQIGQGRLLQEGDKNVLVIGGMAGGGFYDPNGSDDGWVEDETYEQYKERMYNKSVEMLNKKVTAEFRNYETEKTKKLTFQVVGVMDADMPNNYASYAPLEVVQKMQKLMMTSEEKSTTTA